MRISIDATRAAPVGLRSVVLLSTLLLAALGGGCGPADPCAGAAGTCLTLDLVASPPVTTPLSEVTVDLRGAYVGRQIVGGMVALPALVGIQLPDTSGEVTVLVAGRVSAGMLLAGTAKVQATPGAAVRVPLVLMASTDPGTPCGVACPLGCNFDTRQCYGPKPSNLPGPVARYFLQQEPLPLEISGTVYLDTVACQLSDGQNPVHTGRYKGTLDGQDRGPQICVIGVTDLTLSPGARLIAYSSNDGSSTYPAAILSRRGIQIAGTLDARGCLRDRLPGHAAGPGGYWGAHGLQYSQVDTCGGGDGDSGSGLSPGGGGGGHGTVGGKGGSPTASIMGGRGGVPSQNGDELRPLRGGCGGGFAGGTDPTGEGGGGGGAVQLVAATVLEIASSGVVDVSGCGARGGAVGSGGTGGGAGGGILIEAATFNGSGVLAASGGGGAGPGASGAIGDKNGGGAGGKPGSGPAGGRGAGDLTTLSGNEVKLEPGQPGDRTSTLGGGGGGGLGRVRLNISSSAGFSGALVGVVSRGMPERE